MKTVGIECESIEGKNPMFGVGRMIMKLLEEISRKPELEQNYHFILYFKDNVPDFEFLKSPIFKIKKVPVPLFKNRLFPIYYFALLPIRLWFDRPDVMFWPNYMLPILAFGKSVVTLTEDVYYEAHEGKLPFRYKLAYGIFGWWTAKFADKIIAISETSKKNLVKLYNINPNRITVNYPGIGFHKLTNDEEQDAGSYILFVGQMFPRRHAKDTILAFEKLSKEFPKLKLIAIGPDKYPEPLINSLVLKVNERLGQEAITHKDYVNNEELTKLYAGARVLAYVSDREAFGLPPMEALSFGVPPIVADNELGHELFGEYAFYIKGSGSEEIINGISQVFYDIMIYHKNKKVEEKLEKIKNEGPDFVKKYNWKNFAERFIENLK